MAKPDLHHQALPRGESAMKYAGVRPRKTFEGERTCEEPDCGTILSMYNGGSRCSLHAPPDVRLLRLDRMKRHER